MAARIVSTTLLLLGIFPLQTRADVPRTTGEDGRAQLSPFLPYPTEAEILAELPTAPPRHGLRISFHVSAPRMGPLRNFPQVGQARLVSYLFRCTVHSNRGREVVYIEKGELRQAK